MLTKDDTVLASRIRRLLLYGLALCFVLTMVGIIGFENGVYGTASHYPRWAYVVQRTSYYGCLCAIFICLAIFVALPGRARSFGIFCIAITLFGTASFLTEGEPDIHYSGPRYYVQGPNTPKAPEKSSDTPRATHRE